MSNRMNYGPRFRSSAVSVGAPYDAAMAEASHRDNMRMVAILKHQPQYKQELRQHKTSEKSKKRHADIAAKNHRYEAEQRMEEAVRKCVETLEFHMNDLMEHTYTTARPKLVDQTNIHNVIVQLRKKCGVIFENDLQYDHHIQIDCGGGWNKHSMDSTEQRKAEMEQQKLHRMRNNKEVAKRFREFREKHDGNRNEQ